MTRARLLTRNHRLGILAVAVLVMGILPTAAAQDGRRVWDDFDDPIWMNDPLPDRHAGDSSEATSEPGEPTASCVANDSHSVWYAYTPTADIEIVVGAFSDEYELVLSVYEDDWAEEIECDLGDPHPVAPATATFEATAGVTYYFRVAQVGPGPGGGWFWFTAAQFVFCRNALATIVGTPGDDVIDGTDDDDVIVGLGGDDTIRGMDGDDLICGNAGHDTIYGGPGDDRAWGHGGRDMLYGSPGNDILKGGGGRDRLYGQADDDRLFGQRGNDRPLNGGAGDDIINGNTGNDRLVGKRGNDLLKGGDGDDRLWGNAGNDTLRGHQGYDILRGGTGTDICTTGENVIC